MVTPREFSAFSNCINPKFLGFLLAIAFGLDEVLPKSPTASANNSL